jgi:hypothetical protein
MRKLIVFWYFYKKILLPCISFAVIAGLFVASFDRIYTFRVIGVSYLFLSPFFHFMFYEFRKGNEYVFYHNLGFSKLGLWVSSVSVSFLIYFIFRII